MTDTNPLFQPIYFSPVDDQWAFTRNYKIAFMKDFIHTLLFEGDLVITDAFWYSSVPLVEKIPRKTLIECLKHGVLRPYFRDDGNREGSFITGLDDWQGSFEIPRNMRPNARKFAEELDRHVLGHDGYSPKCWPTNTAVTYFDEVEAHIATDESPIGDDRRAVALWESTSLWRKDAFREAALDGELQRTRWLSAIAKHCPDNWEIPADPESAANILSRAGESQAKKNLRDFFHWMIHAYHSNQAKQFEIERLFFRSEKYQQLFQFSILPERYSEGTVEFDGKLYFLPSPAALLSMDIGELLKIRSGDEGGEYFTALNVWQDHSNETTADEVLRKLGKYCERIRRACASRRDEIMVTALTNNETEPSRAALSTMLDGLSFLLAGTELGTAISVSGSLIRGGTSLYVRAPAHLRKKMLEVSWPQRLEIKRPKVGTQRCQIGISDKGPADH